MRVAVVASVIARYDAISTAAYDSVRAFRGADGFDVDVFAARCDFPELRAHEVQHATALEAHRAFRTADIVLYHFGICSPLFETIARGDGRARRIVYFHGLTPREYLAPSQLPLLEQSLRQLRTARHADGFWATSPTTAEALAAAGVDRKTIEVIPLAIEKPAPAALADKPGLPIRLLFVGRLVASKGAHDLIEAIDLVRARTAVPFELEIAGNEEYSDASYVGEVKSVVAKRGLSAVVRILGAVEDAQLDALYRAAHLLVIPSYHEGFCRPVIEGLRAGCVPVGYAAYNLPHAAHGLGRMVATGDRGALATALVELTAALAPRPDPTAARLLPLDGGPLSRAGFDAATQSYVRDFAFDRVAAQMVGSVQRLLAR